MRILVLGAGAMLAAAAAAQEPVYDDEGIGAVAYADCDGDDYALVSFAGGTPPGRVAAALSPHLEGIFTAAAAWLDARCGDTRTITVVGVVDAAPVHAVAGAREAGWAPGSAALDARSLAFLAPALPAAGEAACEAADGMAAAGDGAGALRTRMFTARMARTTGQWNRREALAALVKVHREAAALFVQRGFSWSCPGAFDAAALAVETGRARAESLRENADDLLALDPAALRDAAFGGPDAAAPIADFREIVADTPAGPAIRYGGFRFPIVARLWAAAGGDSR